MLSRRSGLLMTSRRLSRLVGKAWTVPNLSRTYSPARHECGTKICREKGIEYARRLLGHASISTTQRYMHLDDRELADAQDLVEYSLTVTALSVRSFDRCLDGILRAFSFSAPKAEV